MGHIKASKEAVTPETPPTGFCKLYFKTDGELYKLDENGIETPVGVDTDVLVKVSSNDTVAKFLEDAIAVTDGTNTANILEISTLNEGGNEQLEVKIDETKISMTSSQISDFATSVQSAETDTTLQKIGNTLRYIGEDGTNQDIDLSIYLDDTNLARLVSGTLNPTTGILTVTRDDTSTFTIDLSGLLDTDTTDHTLLSNIGTNTHAQIDTHIADSTIHFTQAAISITASQVSDFDTEVSNNTDVSANTSARHDAVTLNAGSVTQESANLVGQELELNQATTISDGVMSSEDKTKLDAIASGANNYTHPNHTGEVTSIADGVQTLDKTAITNKTTISAESGDFVLVSDTSDGGNLKKVDINDLLDDTNTGENNTASNVGVGGVGVFKQKTGVDLEFKNVNAGSNKISITDDVANNEIDIDVNDSNLTITASQVSDFDTEVSNNTSVASNTSNSHTQGTDLGLDTGGANPVTALEITTHIADSTIHFTQAAINITASQVSDFDTEVSNNASVTANTAKVTNATHTGEVTGSGVLTVDKTAISNQTEVTAATDDYVLIGDTSDLGNLKKVTAQSIADLFNGNNGLVSKADSVAGASFVTASGDKVYDVVFSTAFADANYSISISASIERMWTWESKTATGFRINAHSNNDLTGETVDWVATKHGES